MALGLLVTFLTSSSLHIESTDCRKFLLLGLQVTKNQMVANTSLGGRGSKSAHTVRVKRNQGKNFTVCIDNKLVVFRPGQNSIRL